jgi:hypothetical protein
MTGSFVKFVWPLIGESLCPPRQEYAVQWIFFDAQ